VNGGDPEAGLFATLLAVFGLGGGGVYRVAHKQSELAARVDRLDEDRRQSERKMEEGRRSLDKLRQTVTGLDSKVDVILDLVRKE